MNTKSEIHQKFVEKLEGELASITQAAKNTYATATDEEHQAEHKYDTFSLESSYLARGQAKRVDELTLAVDSLRTLSLSEYGDETPVDLGALVDVSDATGNMRHLFLCPAGGGEQLETDVGTVTMVTPDAPIGKILLGRKKGDRVILDLGREKQELTLINVR